jgi:hypothetical protein
MAQRMNRRRFLQGAAAGGAAFLIPGNSRSVWSAEANAKLSIALIGVGGRGEWFVDTIPKMENVVAFCDVNQQQIDKAFERGAQGPARLAPDKVKTYHDFRKMFDEMGKAIDAAIVATPDHIHGVASAATMHTGKHVYCEKPLTRAVGESRALRELALREAACRGGKPAWASFDYADALNEHNMLGNVATRFEGKLEFDPVACKIVNNAEADKLLRLEYRQGWSL